MAFTAWRRDGPMRPYFIVAGWSLIASGIWFWAARFADSGVAIAVAVVICAAYVFLAYNAFRARHNSTLKQSRTSLLGDVQAKSSTKKSWSKKSANAKQAMQYARNAIVILLAGPVAGVAAALAGVSAMKIIRSLGGTEADSIVAAYMLVPSLWAGAAAYMTIEKKLNRKAPVLLSLAALSAAHLSFAG
ncbi:MAG: hypothetical protein AAGD92_06690 [Pseudomonadota bacterium]